MDSLTQTTDTSSRPTDLRQVCPSASGGADGSSEVSLHQDGERGLRASVLSDHAHRYNELDTSKEVRVEQDSGLWEAVKKHQG